MKLKVAVLGATCVSLIGLATVHADCPPECPIPGGKRARSKTECFAEFGGIVPTNTKNPGNVVCADGDACDTDGAPNGTCTFSLTVCFDNADSRFQRCNPTTLTKVVVKKAKKDPQLQALQAAIDAIGFPTAENKCTDPIEIKVPLKVKVKKKGKVKKVRPGKKTVKILARAGRKKDVDKLKLKCVPSTSPSLTCPANPTDGPDLMILTVGDDTDLDTGWNGVAHNQTIVKGGRLLGCLSNCDLENDTVCDVQGTDAEGPEGSKAGGLFGSPLPLFAAGSVPVCVTNTHVEDVTGTIDLATGMTNLRIHLDSKVFVTATPDPRFPCPICTGKAIGDKGKCRFGPKDGQPCTVNGVTKKFGNTSFDCPPGGNASSLDILFDPATTEESTLEATDNICAPGALGSGPCHCPGQTGRFGVGCNSYDDCVPCSGPSRVGEGIDQTCCAITNKPCYPKLIKRTGVRNTLNPAPPDPTYPKTGSGALVSTFCIGATKDASVNNTAGLPGAGTVTLAGNITVLKTSK